MTSQNDDKSATFRFEIPEPLLARARAAAAIEGISVDTFLEKIVHPEPVQFRPPEEWPHRKAPI